MIALSLEEVVVLDAAKEPSTKQQIVQRAVQLAGTHLFDARVAGTVVDRLFGLKLLTKADAGHYELTQAGFRAASESLTRIDNMVSVVRYGVRS